MTVLLPQPGREGFDALGFDPAPGEVGNIETLSTNYTQVSQSLEQAHQALTRIASSSGIWQGQAADNFRDTVGELPDYLDKAYRSLGDAATALQGWRTDLGSMQRTAADLERQAQQAQRQLEQAEANPDLGLAGRFFPDGESLQAAQQKLDAATKRLQGTQQELEAIREQARRLLDQHEQLAQEVAKALERAKDIAPEEPGFFEELGETIGRALDSGIEALGEGLEQLAAASGNIIANLGDVAGDISTMLSVVSGVVELVPGVGTVVGTALDAVGLGLSVTALGAHAAGDALGADIPPETYGLDVAAIGLSTASLVTPVPGVGLGIALGNLGGQALGEAATGGEASTFYDNIGTYWTPDNPVEAGVGVVSPVGLAVWNAVEEGFAETERGE
ncbi:MAG: putative T7SS-secreted protein [Pseudonocardiaceae bacterium]